MLPPNHVAAAPTRRLTHGGASPSCGLLRGGVPRGLCTQSCGPPTATRANDATGWHAASEHTWQGSDVRAPGFAVRAPRLPRLARRDLHSRARRCRQCREHSWREPQKSAHERAQPFDGAKVRQRPLCAASSTTGWQLVRLFPRAKAAGRSGFGAVSGTGATTALLPGGGTGRSARRADLVVYWQERSGVRACAWPARAHRRSAP